MVENPNADSGLVSTKGSGYGPALQEISTAAGGGSRTLGSGHPGGYLDQVNEILGNFVPAGKPVSIVKYRDNTEINDSNGTQLLNF